MRSIKKFLRLLLSSVNLISFIKSIIRIKKNFKNHQLYEYHNTNFLLFYIRYIFTLIFSNKIPYSIFTTNKLYEPLNLKRSYNFAFNGFFEFEEITFLMHYLGYEDIFFDVGANIGVYTIAASKSKVKKIYSFEPSKRTLKYLHKNIKINNITNRVITENFAISSQEGKLKITKGMNVSNKILDNNVNYRQLNLPSETVKASTLDNYCMQYDVIPTFLKIDIEGFELNAIKGCSNILTNKKLNVIQLELNNHGNKFYNLDENVILEILADKGFKKYKYFPFERILCKLENYERGDVLFIRDIELAKAKIKKAEYIFTGSTKI